MQEAGPGVSPSVAQCAPVPALLNPLGTQLVFPCGANAMASNSFLVAKQPPRHKCGNQRSCPQNYFAFKITSGAANVVGPSICFEDKIIMSSVKNNIGRGLNIMLVNGESGGHKLPSPHTRGPFLPREGTDINKLDAFLQEIKVGTIVLVASYDDPATKMNAKVQAHFERLGSSHVRKLGFRDNWVFLGAKGMKNKSPFEEHIKNDRKTNKYDGWPEMLEMEGCTPRKMD
uniref:FAM3 metabolism regulating signaling molecule D n=1 Tax=Calidris pygmaea TaxID=425635 RepID=A0A8C3JUW6_9CHAR